MIRELKPPYDRCPHCGSGEHLRAGDYPEDHILWLYCEACDRWVDEDIRKGVVN